MEKMVKSRKCKRLPDPNKRVKKSSDKNEKRLKKHDSCIIIHFNERVTKVTLVQTRNHGARKAPDR